MTENHEMPKWVKDSQEQLKSIGLKIEDIKKQGQAEVRRGLEKIKGSTVSGVKTNQN